MVNSQAGSLGIRGNQKKTRLFELRNNLDWILERLTESLTIDIRGENLEKNLQKIIDAIKEC